MAKGVQQSSGRGAAAKTSKKRVKTVLTKAGALDLLVELKRSGGGLEPIDEDGLSPRHRAVLRARGVDRASYATIAEALGVSVATVARVLKEALEKLDAHISESAARVRSMDLAKLDVIEAVHTPKMLAGEKVSADLILRVIARRAKIMGYTPKEAPDVPEGEIDVPTWTPVDQDAPLQVEADLDAQLAREIGGDDAA